MRMDYFHWIDVRLTGLYRAAAANDDIWRAMQPYPDVPFSVSGLDPDVIEAWTRTGLFSESRTIDFMHPDRLVNLRSLVRKSPLISKDRLVRKGKILDRIEKGAMASKSISSRKARRGVNRKREMVKEVQETMAILKKRFEQMDDEELEGHQDEVRVHQVTSTEAAAGPLSGAKVGPSLSTKLNYILCEVCLCAWIDDVDYIPPACRSSDTLGRKSS